MQSLVNLSNHLIKPRNHASCWFVQNFNSWVKAIRNAPSPHEALGIYCQMQRQSIRFDSFSMLLTLKSCTQLKSNAVIQHLHAHILKLGFRSDLYVASALLNAHSTASLEDACVLFDEMPDKNTVTWNTMISGYLRSGDVKRARLVFEEMPLRDIASFSAMISGYVQNGNHKHALLLFRSMVMNENEGIRPDGGIAVSVLSSCARMGTHGLLLGKSVHGFVVKNHWELNVELGTTLVDMYAKCRSLKGAARVFELMQVRSVMSWTALICGSAQHGCSRAAFSLFGKMQQAGVRPSERTFTGILSACMHKGLVEEGRKYFKLMEESGMEPTIQHYGCIVHLYCKAGLLEEAYEVIKKMRHEPDIYVCESFLSACMKHKRYEMAERVAEQAMKMVKPRNDDRLYSLISDLYALGGKWDDADRVRNFMVKQNARTVKGSRFVRTDSRMLTFHLSLGNP
ncbi:unnamed protein product [Prunus armeniaca]|uniref:Pentacotripeptide-repeat region of PRORP domain-containing protein n=1 Tax=Prunus armeniaca TaxID=36596 RepID=A0A6J5ULK3_PRUAR|nr:unnamed protein product [Prunus armeniaca]